MSLYVKFWGTRGSLPTPASWTRIHGGNTACVEIRTEDAIFICDAGSGIRELGKDIIQRTNAPSKIHLFLSHTHWDHIQGFPFFPPAYFEDSTIYVYGVGENDDENYKLLSGQMDSRYFPVVFSDLGAHVAPASLDPAGTEIDGVRISSFELNHPGGCHAFRFEHKGIKIIYASDQEIVPTENDVFPDSNNEGPTRELPPELVENCKDADLLIMDSQYNDEQYNTKRGWGHTSAFTATDLGVVAKARQLALFHHDPSRDDEAVAELERLARERLPQSFAAREGVTIDLEAP